ncbi:MAG TPA: MerR family transcriptional regulator [Anaerolineaceae bacterium]|jgi:DNA-binding transcriptional MerR regulator|nr:MerR family transcriptional regulator [Chloroflexota bacterium]HOF28369.1 MerR family transcriptional regulator [Anaerolineaceae bacterium]
MTTIDSFPTEPTLTIKAVQNRTGIKPVTLRAWERRYDLLQPTRMANGYRLYSERDVQLLLWVQRKLDSDMTISQVVQQFKRDREKGVWPESVQIIAAEPPRRKAPRPARDFAEFLFGALISHNQDRANAILDECQSYFDLTIIFEEIIRPSTELLHEAWYRGDILIATEHIALTYLNSKLQVMMQNLPVVKEGALILVGCGPEEMLELNALMLAVLLRQSGLSVEYLGPDLPVEDLLDYSTYAKPKLICLTINQEPTAYLMRGFAEKLVSLRGKPKLAYGGRYMDENPSARKDLGGIYLGASLQEAVTNVKRIITFGE